MLSESLSTYDPDRLAVLTPSVAWTFGETAMAHALPALRSAMTHNRIALRLRDPARLTVALAGLDGLIGGLFLLDHETADDTARSLVRRSGASLVLTDVAPLEGVDTLVWKEPLAPISAAFRQAPRFETEWILATSGTTGEPKLVRHTLGSLTRTTARSQASAPLRWGLLYNVCRFAGAQVVLQSLIGGGTLLAPGPDEMLPAKLKYFVDAGATAISATPTMWRKILMTPESAELSLRQITLGGEIVDDAILRALAARFPQARIVHIYASTEAGAAFSVTDGRAGFPTSFLGAPPKGIELRLDGERLWVRTGGQKSAYIGSGEIFADEDGFVDTGDVIDVRGDRCHFLGRDSGMINVGGNKLFPEEVEGVLLDHPLVRLVRVSSKNSPITGQLVVAEVAPADGAPSPPEINEILLAHCRVQLPAWKVPALVRVVDDFKFNAGGKMQRPLR